MNIIQQVLEFEAVVTESSLKSNVDNKRLNKIKIFNKELAKYEYIVVTDQKEIISKISIDSFNRYRSLSSKEFKKYKGGICWDYVNYEYEYFHNNFKDVPIKTFFFAIVDSDGNINHTHTFLLFYLNDYVYWFEASWKRNIGIIRYQNEDDALSNIVSTLRMNHDDKLDWFIVEYKPNEKLINISDKSYLRYMAKLPEYTFKYTDDVEFSVIQKIKVDNGKIINIKNN